MKENRIKRLRKEMIEKGVEAILFYTSYNQYYYSEYNGGDAYLLITMDRKIIITDFRYKEQLKIQAPLFEHVIINNNLNEDIANLINELKFEKIYIEGTIPYQAYREISKKIDSKLVYETDFYNDIRIIKDSQELKKIAKSQEIADNAFRETLNIIKPGITEKEIDLELEYQMKKFGAEKKSFDFIIASGSRSALPHGTASRKKIDKNDILTIDFGAIYDGYCSDCTRTIFIGNITKKQKKVYEIVKKAQFEAQIAVRANESAYHIDEIARDIIKAEGFGEKFGHGTGHGVGLEIHENPRLSYKTDKNFLLKPNMVITIEPGIYIEEEFGIRIEDMVVVTEDGSDVFTTLTKDIIIL